MDNCTHILYQSRPVHSFFSSQLADIIRIWNNSNNQKWFWDSLHISSLGTVMSYPQFNISKLTGVKTFNWANSLFFPPSNQQLWLVSVISPLYLLINVTLDEKGRYNPPRNIFLVVTMYIVHTAHTKKKYWIRYFMTL